MGNLGWKTLDGAWHHPKIVNIPLKYPRNATRKTHTFSLFKLLNLYHLLLKFVTNLKHFVTIEGFCRFIEKS